MPSLLPPNATPLMRALETVITHALNIDHPIAEILNPDTCPAKFLPFLAWQYSVDVWRPEWPEHIQRARIKASISVHNRKGTAAAVREVVGSFGGNILLREWFEMSAPGYTPVPGTFEITMNVSGSTDYTNTASFIDDIIAEVNRTKPESAHYTFTQGANLRGDIGFVGAVRGLVYRRIEVTATESP